MSCVSSSAPPPTAWVAGHNNFPAFGSSDEIIKSSQGRIGKQRGVVVGSEGKGVLLGGEGREGGTVSW